jgi:hypothetical protein
MVDADFSAARQSHQKLNEVGKLQNLRPAQKSESHDFKLIEMAFLTAIGTCRKNLSSNSDLNSPTRE